MSSFPTTAVNANAIIARLVDVYNHSANLFPLSIGHVTDSEDLVEQVIPYELPVPTEPREGGGPPHIYVTASKQPNPTFREFIGRSTIDRLGPEHQIWEFYCIVVAHNTDPHTSETDIYNITQAMAQTLDTNKRLLDHTGANPLCAWVEWITVPYLLDSDSKEVKASNVIVRCHLFVNLR